MIVCPKCGSQTGAKESRTVGNFTRRRRICRNIQCNHRVTTVELAVERMRRLADPVIVSRSALEAILAAFGTAIADSIGREVVLESLAVSLPIQAPGLDDEDDE